MEVRIEFDFIPRPVGDGRWYLEKIPRKEQEPMPKAFTDCQSAGGKIRTKTLGEKKYVHVCIKPGGSKGPRGGRTVAGEVKTKKAAR